MATLRIGTLGAARITPNALLKPAKDNAEVEVIAVAARDRGRAEEFAGKWGITKVHDGYEAVVHDPDVDAIYNPLPNSLHARWTEEALAAGKHVLCEKPFASNAAEGERVAAAAAGTDRVVMEAFHYRYHPVAERMREIAQSGELGPTRHIRSSMCIPLPMRNDIRYRYDLAGGAVMDVGCYALHMNRLVAGAEPEVTSATAKTTKPDVDRWMKADLLYPDGTTGRMTCALMSGAVLRITVQVTCERGTLWVFNPTGPQYSYLMGVHERGKLWPRSIRVPGAKKSSYAYQLDAFADAVLRGGPVLTPPTDAVANLKVMDAVYEAAGLPPRGT